MADEIIVLITASSKEEASLIANMLVNERLAACVNILPGLHSVFFWEGKTQSAEEILLICKSRLTVFEKLKSRVRELHSYSVPEIIALPIIAGYDAYLDWLKENMKG